MKSKGVTYALSVAVVAVWALVIYRAFRFVDSPPRPAAGAHTVVTVQHGDGADYSLIADYRDPFTGISSPRRVVPSRTESKTRGNAVYNGAVVDSIEWPSVKYFGSVKNAGGKEVAIMRIDGKQYTLSLHDVVKGLSVQRIAADSVQLQFLKSKKFFFK